MRPRRITADVPVFEGSGELLKLLAGFVRRPLRGESPEPERHRNVPQGREGLPVICLVSGPDHSRLADGIATFLRQAAPRRAPYCLVRLPSGERALSDRESVEEVRRTLEKLGEGLALKVNGRDGRVRFRRFGLVSWLMQQGGRDASNSDLDGSDHSLLRDLRERELSRRWVFGILRSPQTELSLQGKAPWWLWLLMLHLIPLTWFRVRRGLGGEYRWLLNQPYLSPGDPGTFEGFAERLTTPHIEVEDTEQLRKLMVNAFLEDLRAAYRRRLWRPSAFRRTAYCVAVLDGLGSKNHSYTLLETIIDVRIETGAFDPLLVTGLGADAPPHGSWAHEDWGDDLGAWEPDGELRRDWQHTFRREGRGRSRRPWYLAVRTPRLMSRDANEREHDSRHRQETSEDSQLRILDPPRWARRGALKSAAAIAVVIVAAVALVGLVQSRAGARDFKAAHCGLSRSEVASETLETAATGECIGVASNSSVFPTKDEGLAKVLTVISDQNRRAELAHRNDPDRPIITLVHLSALLSSSGKSTSQFAYVREALQGAASSQSRQLTSPGGAAPLLRIFPANAGLGMRYGERVADILGRMRRRDPSIVGVTGLDQSREATSRTIRRLTRIGLPMVATTLSADSLAHQSPLYFQVSPQNMREAVVAAAYAERLVETGGERPQRKVRIVHSADPTDIYSSNLKADAWNAFGACEFQREDVPYAPPSTPGLDASGPGDAGHRSCGYDGLIFFAGRSEDFESLLDGVNQVCHSAPPVLLGDDDVARLAADPERRRHFPGISYDFVDFTLGSAACDGTSELYSEMKRLFPDECGKIASSSLDVHASLAFDAVKLYVNAVKQLREDASNMPLTPAAVWHAISRVYGKRVLDGQSGNIGFGGAVDRQIPLDKLISIQRIDAQGNPSQRGFCGRVGARSQDSWCPGLEPGHS